MKLYDGLGTAFDTESKPLSIEDRIESNQIQLRELKQQIKQLHHGTKLERRTAERLQSQHDTLTAETKKLLKKYQQQF
jgi:chromosome segregation ATPase